MKVLTLVLGGNLCVLHYRPCHGYRRHLDEYENLISNDFRRTAVLKKI